ncbi:prolyl oligopeptidase family serine peptidase [Elongatibacter sediminis]|uniref:Prolyl oligopeptidase family serine peptidase n=1 Tax=Elongatibacter sediminis TaxID=3119006 RepID=A0AAW9R6M5_9GAMM
MKYRILLVLAVATSFVFGTSRPSLADDSPAPGLTVEEIVTLKKVRQAVLSPTGDRVAYLLEVPRTPYLDEDGSAWVELHVVDLAGHSRPMFTGKVNASSPQWSADGDRVYFIARETPLDPYVSLLSVPVSGGGPTVVFRPARDIGALHLSPDGRTAAFLATAEPTATQLDLARAGLTASAHDESAESVRVWLVDLENGTVAAPYLPGSASDFAWSPDGSRYAVALAPSPMADDWELNRDIVVVETRDASRRHALGVIGKLGAFAWSPDGRHIAYIAGSERSDPNPGRLFVRPAGGGEREEWLPEYPGQVEALAWSGADTVTYIGSLGLDREIARVSGESSRRAPVSGPGAQTIIWQSMDAHADLATVAAVGHTLAHPAEVYLIQDGEPPRRLTDSNPLLAERRLGRQEAIRIAARDGVELDAVVIHPVPDAGHDPAQSAEWHAAPLIVFAHGGPEGHYGNGWLSGYDEPAQALAAQGFRVVFPNYRGSTGRGVAFSKMGQGDPAGAEFNDLVDTRQYFVDRGLADPDRVGIAGISYGGYAAMWAATAQTDYFAAAVSFVGLSNLVSAFGTTDIPGEMQVSHTRAWPWDDWTAMLERSPVFHAGQSRTPLLISGGDSDERFHPAQSLELYRHLKLRTETPVRLVTYPGEGHGHRNTAARYDYALRLERWMNHYLQGPGGEPPPFDIGHGSRLLTRNAADASPIEGGPPEYDLVIRGGMVLDGRGNPPTRADVAIDDGRFVAMGEVPGRGLTELDAHGRMVSPGWIDMMDQSGETLLRNGLAENKLLMGVTTAFGGEGGTPVPAKEIPEYFARLEEQGISLNFGSYYNAFQAREAVVGEADVAVTEADLSLMRAEMRRAMQAGAVGMSSAAFYPPASFMSTEELVELGKAMAPFGGIHAAHLRDESRHLLEAIDELITVGEQAGIRVEIFHFKNAFAPNWGRTVHEAIERIEAARARGVDIGANQYPYIAGGTGIDATVPAYVFANGRDDGMALLADPVQRQRLKAEIADPRSDRMVMNAGGWQNIVLMSAFSERYEPFQGMDFVQIGRALERDPADAAWDIMLEALPRRANALYFLMSEPDVQTILRQPWVSIGSDAGTSLVLGRPDDMALPHPRTYGTFPRIIARYVRDLGLFGLPEAVRRMTSLPASRMSLEDRGVIEPGRWADVVIFDDRSIRDTATFEEPLRVPAGIDYVLVNGEIVVDHGRHTGARPGRVLYGPGHDPAAMERW